MAVQGQSPKLPYFLARPSTTSSSYDIGSVLDFDTFFANVPEDSVSYQIVNVPATLLRIRTARGCLFRPFTAFPEPWLASA